LKKDQEEELKLDWKSHCSKSPTKYHLNFLFVSDFFKVDFTAKNGQNSTFWQEVSNT